MYSSDNSKFKRVKFGVKTLVVLQCYLLLKLGGRSSNDLTVEPVLIVKPREYLFITSAFMGVI